MAALADLRIEREVLRDAQRALTASRDWDEADVVGVLDVVGRGRERQEVTVDGIEECPARVARGVATVDVVEHMVRRQQVVLQFIDHEDAACDGKGQLP